MRKHKNIYQTNTENKIYHLLFFCVFLVYSFVHSYHIAFVISLLLCKENLVTERMSKRQYIHTHSEENIIHYSTH